MIRSNHKVVMGMLSLIFLFPPKNLVFNFQRVTTEGNKVERLLGTTYYQEGGRSIILVHEPIQQIMIFEASDWYILYPQKNITYLIQGSKPFQIPFLDVLIGACRDDFGLSQKGFTLVSHKSGQDTLYSFWHSGESRDPALIKLTQVGTKLIVFELVIDDTARIRTTLDEYKSLGDIHIPMRITSSILRGFISTAPVSEIITIDNPVRNAPIPDDILNIALPQNPVMIRP